MHTPELDPFSPARKFSFEQRQMLILLDRNDMACDGQIVFLERNRVA